MIRDYELRWYEYNLTVERRKRFFTRIGALLYKWYLLRFNGEIAKTYVYEKF